MNAETKRILADAGVFVAIVLVVAVSQCFFYWNFCSPFLAPDSAELKRARYLVEHKRLLGLPVGEVEALLGPPESREWIWVYALNDQECYCKDLAMFGYLTKCNDALCLIVWFGGDGTVVATSLDGLCKDVKCGVSDVLQRDGRYEAVWGGSLIGRDLPSVLMACGEPDRETRRYVYDLGLVKGWGELDHWWLMMAIDRAGFVSSASVEKH